MLEKNVTIINKLGLHARASAKFVALASKFHSQIEVSRGPKTVNGKSIMGVMMLAAAKDCELVLKISGEDKERAMEALITLIENRFDEIE